MEGIHFKTIGLLRRRLAGVVSSLCLLGLAFQAAAQPVLSPPVWGADRRYAYLTLSNYDTNVPIVIQMSTNLTDWQPVQPLELSPPSNFFVTVSTTNQVGFYRVLKLPYPFPTSTFSIFCKSNFDVAGNFCTLDSFDSTDPNYSTFGLYDPSKRKANACIATDGTFTNSLSIGNANVYGTIYTGMGTTSNSVFLHLDCSVGDLTWVPATAGVQPGHWFGNLSEIVPKVAAPNTNGWSTTLPVAINGTVTLAGGNYVVGALNYPLVVAGPTTLWVKNSLNLGVTITNGGSLILYVGNTSGSASTLNLSGKGTMNSPGIAANFQIYGLPTLTSIDFSGNAGWTAAVYAPEANFTVGPGGNNTQEASGRIVAKNITQNGHLNFHYDESLSRAGLLY